MKKVITIIIAIGLLFCTFAAMAEEINLSQMTKAQLDELKERINQEIKENHTLSSKEETALTKAAKEYIESMMSQDGLKVSWAWVDYSYTKDWDYATISTHFDAKNSSKKTTRYEVLCGAYLQNNVWNICYVELNGQIVFDVRDTIPDPRLNPNASEYPEVTATPEPTPEPTPEITATPVPTPEPTPEITAIPEPTPEPTPEITATLAPTDVPMPTPTNYPALSVEFTPATETPTREYQYEVDAEGLLDRFVLREEDLTPDVFCQTVWEIIKECVSSSETITEISLNDGVMTIYIDLPLSAIPQYYTYNDYAENLISSITDEILDFEELDKFWDIIKIVFPTSFVELKPEIIVNSQYGRYFDPANFDIVMTE